MQLALRSNKRKSYSITGAPTGHKQDVRSREVRYLWSMGVRTVCFLGALVTPGVFRWVLFAAALFLPYIAVIIANAGRDTRSHAPASYLPAAGRELPSTRIVVEPTAVVIPDGSVPKKTAASD